MKDNTAITGTINISMDSLREDIYLSLINADANKDVLASVPHTPFHDLAVVPRYRIDDDFSMAVSNNFLERTGLTSEEIMDMAEANFDKQGYVLIPLMDLIGELAGGDGPHKGKVPAMPIYVITNMGKKYGSAAMVSKAFLGSVREKLSGSDFYMLPSSIHELIVLPASEVDDVGVLKKMVYEINRAEVEEKDRLSDSVYLYDGDNITVY